MSKAIRTTLSLVISLVLLSTLTMAKTNGNNADKDKNKQHHSRLSKIAFWRHHKDTSKNAKAQAQSKHAQAKTAQVKPVAAKQATDKKEQKPEQHVAKAKKASGNKAPATNKTKQREKGQDPKAASFQQ
jgi:hypothetical protein